MCVFMSLMDAQRAPLRASTTDLDLMKARSLREPARPCTYQGGVRGGGDASFLPQRPGALAENVFSAAVLRVPRALRARARRRTAALRVPGVVVAVACCCLRLSTLVLQLLQAAVTAPRGGAGRGHSAQEGWCKGCCCKSPSPPPLEEGGVCGGWHASVGCNACIISKRAQRAQLRPEHHAAQLRDFNSSAALKRNCTPASATPGGPLPPSPRRAAPEPRRDGSTTVSHPAVGRGRRARGTRGAGADVQGRAGFWHAHRRQVRGGFVHSPRRRHGAPAALPGALALGHRRSNTFKARPAPSAVQAKWEIIEDDGSTTIKVRAWFNAGPARAHSKSTPACPPARCLRSQRGLRSTRSGGVLRSWSSARAGTLPSPTRSCE
jgi:hypothetical protein